jgi:MFS family permease
VVEAVAPARLGRGFRWLLVSSWLSNLGDGLAVAAGPLLVASRTDDPFLIALGATALWAPPLLFGLLAGAVTDRFDRRRIVIGVALVRCAVLLVLALGVATGSASVAVVLVALFVLGTAETFQDNAAQTLLPALVHRDDLAVGNARLQVGFIGFNQLAGPVLGALLFTAAAVWPVLGQAVLVAAAALLATRIALPPHRPPAARRGLVRDVRAGVRWTWRHPAVRTLVLTITAFNVTFGAAWSVLVLYATERLGLGPLGFAAVTLAQAVGGLVGTVAYGWITRHVTLGGLMRIGLVVETLTHAALAVTTSPAVALPVFAVFGAHAFVWATTATTVRQRAVPTELQGRVGSVNTIGVFGGLVVGSALGGLLAAWGDVTTPFWFAFAGSAVFVVLIWRQLAHIAHDPEPVR